jgi:hypothetical protein
LREETRNDMFEAIVHTGNESDVNQQESFMTRTKRQSKTTQG